MPRACSAFLPVPLDRDQIHGVLEPYGPVWEDLYGQDNWLIQGGYKALGGVTVVDGTADVLDGMPQTMYSNIVALLGEPAQCCVTFIFEDRQDRAEIGLAYQLAEAFGQYWPCVWDPHTDEGMVRCDRFVPAPPPRNPGFFERWFG